MAAFSLGPKLRPCIYEDEEMLFHCWFQVSEIVAPSIMNGGHNGGVISGILGLVEDRKGYIRRVYPEKIQFLDNNIFLDYDFTRREEGET